MSAIAVSRCNRHSLSPSRALPNWRTRRGTNSSRSAVPSDREEAFGIGVLLGEKHVEPGHGGQQRGRCENGVAAARDNPEFKAVAGIPGQMTDAVAQVVEEGD